MSVQANPVAIPVAEPKLADLPTWLCEIRKHIICLRDDVRRIVDVLDGPRDSGEVDKVAVDPRGLRGEIFNQVRDIKSTIFETHDVVREILRELDIDKKATQTMESARVG